MHIRVLKILSPKTTKAFIAISPETEFKTQKKNPVQLSTYIKAYPAQKNDNTIKPENRNSDCAANIVRKHKTLSYPV